MHAALTLSVVLGAGLLTTACSDDSAGGSGAHATGPATAAVPSQDPADGAEETSTGGAQAGDASEAGSGSAEEGASDDAAAAGHGQGCGTDDLKGSAKSMAQGGAYIQVSVTAKSGITCVLPGGLPVVAFGSGGVQAGPAGQTAGSEITLTDSSTVYAGVSPKTTGNDHGAEFDSVIVAASEGDPDPVSLDVDPVLADEPVTTNWRTDPADAVAQ